MNLRYTLQNFTSQVNKFIVSIITNAALLGSLLLQIHNWKGQSTNYPWKQGGLARQTVSFIVNITETAWELKVVWNLRNISCEFV